MTEKFLARFNYSHLNWGRIRAQVIRELELGRVTVHPYGFFILKLDETTDCQLRIHVWLDDQRPKQDPDWAPHDHNSTIASLVLEGELVNQTWRVSENRNGQHILYRVGYEGDCSTLSRTKKRVECVLESAKTVSAGMTYSVPSGTFHSGLVNKDRCAITLCLMHHRTVAIPYVVGHVSGKDAYRFKRANCEARAIKTLIEQLNEFFSRSHSL